MVKWLKRIFSIGTLTLLVSVIAAIIAIKSYVGGLPAQLTIEFNGEELNFSTDTICILELIKNDNRYIDIEDVILPSFVNNSDKIIQNFKCIIDIGNRMEMVPIFNYYVKSYLKNQNNYELIEDGGWALIAKYKNNVLHPHSYVPYPISEFGNEEKCDIDEYFFTYDINYDGCKRPIYLEVFLNVYDGEGVLSNKQVRKIIGERGYFWKFGWKYDNNVSWLYVVAHDKEHAIVKSADKRNEKEFEELAEEFIQEME